MDLVRGRDRIHARRPETKRPYPIPSSTCAPEARSPYGHRFVPSPDAELRGPLYPATEPRSHSETTVNAPNLTPTHPTDTLAGGRETLLFFLSAIRYPLSAIRCRPAAERPLAHTLPQPYNPPA